MRWLCRLVTTWEVPTAVPGRRWELRMLEDAGCKKPAFPSADGYALPLTATVGWVSYVCQEHHETLTRSGLRTVREGRSYSSPSFIQTGPGSSGWPPDMDGEFRGEFLYDGTLPALPQKYAMCLLTMDEGGWKPAQKMVSLKAWWKMITFHSPKSFLLNYQLPCPRLAQGALTFVRDSFWWRVNFILNLFFWISSNSLICCHEPLNKWATLLNFQ